MRGLTRTRRIHPGDHRDLRARYEAPGRVASPGQGEGRPVVATDCCRGPRPRIESMNAPRSATVSETGSNASSVLVGLCHHLGAVGAGGPTTAAEEAVLARSSTPAATEIERVRSAILGGADPLGELLIASRSQLERRRIGQFLTPLPVVRHMVQAAVGASTTIAVDAGCGSGRFALEVARSHPQIPVSAIDLDPLATIVTRANVAVLGIKNVRVIQEDFLTWEPPPRTGSAAFLSNPPYVRHHDLPSSVKLWGAKAARALGHSASSLSGLHAYFLLAAAIKSRDGDRGCFITSSEWLDVGYGSLMRSLLANGLGLELLELIDARHRTFDDAMTTSVVTTFERGHTGGAFGLVVESVEDLITDAVVRHALDRDQLQVAPTWSRILLRTLDRDASHIELGRYARVSRGLVTGANGYFVMTQADAAARGLERWVEPVISSAREVQTAFRGGVIDMATLRCLLVAPREIPDDDDHRPLLDYLKLGAREGHDRGYIASRRRPWWYLGRLPRPTVVATYMTRTGPVFLRNEHRLPILNVAHGLYPHRPMTESELHGLVAVLNREAPRFMGSGRTYHGGLEKFEPGEMERLLIPPLSSAR